MRLDEDALIDEARQATGLDDFGSPDFHDGLRALIGIVDHNPFTDQGRRQHRDRLVQLLSTRLRVQEAFRRHPEIRDRPIAAPMIMTGLPRSGTSALFNLLAADPAARPLLMWEGVSPDPDWDRKPGDIDPRHQALKDWAASERELNPEFSRIHFVDADTPEECVLLQAISFDGGQLGYELLLEPYRSWFTDHDLTPTYAYYADLLRLLDWQRPGERWLLKSPAHLWALGALIEVFPDCSIVWNHRDPAVCMASMSSMIATLSQDLVDLPSTELGPLVLDHYATSMDRAIADRVGSDERRFVDIDYADLIVDNLAAARTVYDRFNLDPGPALPLMEAHIATHPKDAHGSHHYDLATYGLTAEQVRGRFAAYRRRFGV